MIVEILFLAAQFTCGGIPGSFELHTTGGHDLRVGESVVIEIGSIEELEFGYSRLLGAECALRNVPGIHYENGDPLPTVNGYANQADLVDIIEENVTDYHSLVLFEVGTRRTSRRTYDLQDLVVVINADPELEDRYECDNGNEEAQILCWEVAEEGEGDAEPVVYVD